MGAHVVLRVLLRSRHVRGVRGSFVLVAAGHRKDLATFDAHSFVCAGFDVPVAQFVQVRTSAMAPCFWQSLVRCSVFAFGVQEYGFFLKSTSGMFPYSILLGSTEDTCLASVFEALWLPHCR